MQAVADAVEADGTDETSRDASLAYPGSAACRETSPQFACYPCFELMSGDSDEKEQSEHCEHGYG